MVNYKIYMLNEWKESSAYMYTKWFNDIEKDFRKYFESEIYKELEFDSFEYDSTLLNEIQTGFLYFHEKEYQYKLEIIIDNSEIEEDEIINIELRLQGFQLLSGELIGEIKSDIVVKDISENLILELISKFKEEYEIIN